VSKFINTRDLPDNWSEVVEEETLRICNGFKGRPLGLVFISIQSAMFNLIYRTLQSKEERNLAIKSFVQAANSTFDLWDKEGNE
jgi:hypothetical protein